MGEKSCNPLEQFVLLAKTAKGAAAGTLISQALEMPGVYVFGELLEMPHIQELESGPQAEWLNLLNIFAYGTYNNYKENKANLPQLSPVQLTKLRHLTIVTLATKTKRIPYSVLLKELEVENLRKLEDLIIESIYTEIILGKLDQKNQLLEIDYAIGRDIRPDQVSEIINVLQDWCTAGEVVLKGVETQIEKANQTKENNNRVKARIEQEVTNIKKTLKSTQQQDMEEQMVIDSRDVSQTEKAGKKTSKTKGLRGSGKLWK